MFSKRLIIVYHLQVNYTHPILSIFIFVSFLPTTGIASEIETRADELRPPQTAIDVRKLSVDKALNKSGQSIDRFITRRILRKKNEDFSSANANARVTLETGYFQGGKLKSDIDFDISFVLPTTIEHVRLFAGGEKSYLKGDSKTPQTSAGTTLENTDVQAGLQYTFDTIKRWRPRLRGGIKFKTNKLDPFTELKIKRRLGSEKEHTWFAQAGRYSRLKRMVYTTNLDYFRLIKPDWDFRLTNQFKHHKATHHWTYQHSPIITYSFSEQGRWVNQITVSGQKGQSKPYTQATISTRIIHPIFRPWILLEIEPVHTHSLINDNHSNALFLRTHFLFNR